MNFTVFASVADNLKNDVTELEQKLETARQKVVNVELAEISAKTAVQAVENAIKKINQCGLPVDDFETSILNLFDSTDNGTVDSNDDLTLGVDEVEEEVEEELPPEVEEEVEEELPPEVEEEVEEELPPEVEEEVEEELPPEVEEEVEEELPPEVEEEVEEELPPEEGEIKQLTLKMFYQDDKLTDTVTLYIGDKARLRLDTWGKYLTSSLNTPGNKNWIAYNISSTDHVVNVNTKYEMIVKGLTLVQAKQLAECDMTNFPPEDPNEKLISPAEISNIKNDNKSFRLGQKVQSILTAAWIYDVVSFVDNDPTMIIGKRVGQPNAMPIKLSVSSLRALENG